MVANTRFSLKSNGRKRSKARASMLLKKHSRKVDHVVDEAKAFSEDFRRTLAGISDPSLKDSASR